MRKRFVLASLALLAAGCGPSALDSGPDAAPTAAPPDAGELAADAAGGDDVAELLASIEGVRVVSGPSVEGAPAGYEYAELRFEQLIDHGDPARGTFEQKVMLLHRDTSAPVVMVTAGYGVSDGNRLWELTEATGANQIVVEHRHFGDSTPEPFDWDDLTIEQAAHDHHRIVTAFSPQYSGRWATTGISKGGMTATYHRRFFPDDVDATVPYVAPISFDAGDVRYDEFLRALPAECRDRIRAFQREVLQRRDDSDILDLAFADAPAEATYELNGLDYAYESGASSAEWSFWQILGAEYCDEIPGEDATDAELLWLLDYLAGFSRGGGSDRAVYDLLPYQVQAVVELGYPFTSRDHISDLLRESPLDSAFPSDLRPYDPDVMRDVQDWIASQGSELLFIYGEYDPWTAGAYELGEAEDAHLFMAPQASHRASLSRLSAADREEAAAVLARWLETDVTIPSITAQARGPADALPPIEEDFLPPPR